MLNKYYIKDLVNVSTYKENVYISRKFQKEWFKIPQVCLDVLNYSFDKELTMAETLNLFKDDSDKEYFKKILKNLDNMGVLMGKKINKVCTNHINKVTFAITNKCNLRCSFCSQDSKVEDDEELSFQEIISAIDKIMMFDPVKIVITGGEPMIRKDFFDIIDYIKSKYNVDIQLCTNATLIDSYNIEKLKGKIDAVDLSLDGYDEESCYKSRGKDIFKKVVESIELLQGVGISRISASMIFGAYNISETDRFVKFCESKSVIPVKREFMSIGRGKLDKKYLKENLDTMFYPDLKYIDKKICARTCGTGVTQLFIDHRGDIFPCSLLDEKKYKICSVNEINKILIKKIYRRDLKVYESLDKLSPINNYRCKNCKFKLFCNNCIANMNSMIKNEETFKHNCLKLKNIYEKILND